MIKNHISLIVEISLISFIMHIEKKLAKVIYQKKKKKILCGGVSKIATAWADIQLSSFKIFVEIPKENFS